MNPKKPPAPVTKAPHVYRPLPVPRVLQQKRAISQGPKKTQSPQPTPVLQRQRQKPPAVYRPQPVPKVLQKKEATPAVKCGVIRKSAIQTKTTTRPAPPNSRASKSVIQRSEGVYLSQKAKRNYEVHKRSANGKYYLYVTQQGSSAVLANMRYKFYHDGTATMEHVEAYGMPQGTRAGYLLFYIFAEHAAREGIRHVGIGTGVDLRSVTRNLEQATHENNKEGIAEAQRNMAAVHIYKELGFDSSDAVALSRSVLTVQQVRTTAMQKMRGFWQLRPNYRAMIEGFRRMIAEITAPLPVNDQVDRLTGHIGDDDL